MKRQTASDGERERDETMKKVVRLGKSKEYKRVADVFCEINIEDGKLSITGVIGPQKNGDAIGGCGQINGSKPDIFDLAPGWTKQLLAQFWETWDRWHLNDMRPGCEHQRAEKWDERPIDPNKPLRSYGRHFAGQTQDSWNMLAWVRPDEHPEGLLCRPCPVCGYKYGSQWLKEELPADVIRFLESLPETDVQPAWV